MSFDTDTQPPVGNVPFLKLDEYLQQSEFLSLVGPVSNIVAKFCAETSLYTIDVFACQTLKYPNIPVVLAYDFDVAAFNFVGVEVGDCLFINKAILGHACDLLELEIVAGDNAHYYVSLFLFVVAHLFSNFCFFSFL